MPLTEAQADMVVQRVVELVVSLVGPYFGMVNNREDAEALAESAKKALNLALQDAFRGPIQ